MVRNKLKKSLHRRAWTSLVVLFGMLLVFGTGRAFSDEIANLAKKLTEMRGDVESLSSELELKKQRLKNELDALAQQKADLEVQMEREQLHIKELNSALKRRQEDMAKISVSGEELTPMLLETIEKTEGYIAASLPFKVPERLAELEKIKTQINTNVIRPEKAATVLWAFIEDEFRLTRESNLDRQIITVDGKEQLADVARVGMVMMFFRTNGGQFGKAVKKGDSWTYESFGNSRDRDNVAHLFDSFKKQIRVGYFELPNALPGIEVKQ